jgi:hypothetical protein
MSEDSQYLAAFKGKFVSALRWQQLDALWQALLRKAGSGWYVYAIGERPPTSPCEADALERFIVEVDALLRREHEEDYCGIVYADDMNDPGFVKIYDPNNLGVVCGYSDSPPLPGWTLSLLPPADLKAAMPPPNNRRRWWQRLFS